MSKTNQKRREYDGYLGGVCELLASGASDKDIENHLWPIVAERMELNAKKSDMASTVKALREIPLPHNHSSPAALRRLSGVLVSMCYAQQRSLVKVPRE